jgi:hypothetical protein
MLTLKNIPIQIYWRALDLFGQERHDTTEACKEALNSAVARISVTPDFAGISPFAQAVAEYLSLSGAFAEDGGEFAGVNGYVLA